MSAASYRLPSRSAISREQDLRAVRQLAADWRSGWLSGDANTLISLYTDSPVLMPQGSPPVEGKDEIRSLYRRILSAYAFLSEGKLMEVQISGEWGYFWSTCILTATPKAGGRRIVSGGKSIVIIVHRERNGLWKIARLMDNSNGPQEKSRERARTEASTRKAGPKHKPRVAK